ncbi:putative MFS family arabinose efflux permease [Ulvibacter sp. MAR_2010_11]|nr:putative MFS family arabinose efflux permease [Ulvibacter sp. MAR_2010_11]
MLWLNTHSGRNATNKGWMLLTQAIKLIRNQSSSFRGALRASGVMAFAGMGDALLYPVLPVYGKELGFSVFFIGVLLSVNRFVRILANTPIANLITKMGMRNMLLITSLLAVITTFVYGLKLGLIAFLIARILWGLSYSGLKTATLSYAAKAEDNSGLAFGLSQSIQSLGALFVLWFGPILIQEIGFQNGFFIISGLGLIGISMAYSLPKISAEDSGDPAQSKVTFYPNSINLLVVALSISIDGILVVTLAHLLNTSGISSGELLVYVALYLLLKRLFLILFSFVGGMLSLHYSASKLFAISVIGCLFAMALISLNFIITGIILAFLCNTIVVTFSPLVAVKQQKNALQAISSVSTWWDLGAAIGALIGIFIIEILGRQNLFLSLLIITTIIFINYILKNAKPSHSAI